MSDVITLTNLSGLKRISMGKVRDIYEFEDKLLLVATDRLSAFDVVFREGIPDKGKVLTQLSAYWFEQTRPIIENHCITADYAQFPDTLKRFDFLRGRTTLCRRAKVIPIECVARGYLEGSAWKEYTASGTVTGIKLPPGLQRRSRLPEPIFTPATKAETGHDENITFERMAGIVGRETAEAARMTTLKLYNFAHDHLDKKGIVLADTKFEFGFIDGKLTLIDEILTPDSSRFWVKGTVSADGEPISFDKQYVRDYLETLSWDKRPPAPKLPEQVIEQTAKRYLEIFERITGTPLQA
ncbi:phosphoribosylaminoimidazolesuccinocarboxamide synthase [Candidatus Sumerlaeota bacterium]|nr:phosphoribosylaminoimidazolesuccinocarboxamide synthase [Candidatus Sumerlaeota bacterium]MBI3735025.1 phosphoribosylaminoimidazolesuccinocarboxamide synthase [Candidatus Sumerlaeota bacterium]